MLFLAYKILKLSNSSCSTLKLFIKISNQRRKQRQLIIRHGWPVYEDFEVQTEWVREAEFDTLIVNLPGFSKGQIKVQVTSGGILRIYGERPIDGNKFSRFSKKIPISSTYDTGEMRAEFKGGKLHLKLPKLNPKADQDQQEQAKLAAEVPKTDQMPVYEDFEVQTEWVHEASYDALIVIAQDFMKEELKVQVSEGKLKVSGEHSTGDNKFSRFHKEFPIPSNWDQNKIRADGKLQVKHHSGHKQEVAKLSGGNGNGNYNQQGIFKQGLSSLVMGLKNPRKIINMVLVVFLVVLLALFLINGIRSLGNY